MYLPNHVFSCGQSYVALWEEFSTSTTNVLVRKCWSVGQQSVFTQNIVYKVVMPQSANDDDS